MRELLTRGVAVVGALVAALLLLVAPVLAVEGDTVADAALGQSSLTTNQCNSGGISARSLCGPMAVAMDPTSGRLFVADAGNNRVLSFSNTRRFQNGEAADLVLGQPDFTTVACPGLNEHSICTATSLAVDRSGRLYVAESLGRVLRFDEPRTNGQPADLVLGQADFVSASSFVGAGAGGAFCRSQGSLCVPTGVTTDGAGRVYVSDSAFGVLVFNSPENNGQPPALVVGNSDQALRNGCVSIFCAATGITVTPDGVLYVADSFHQRVLRFSSPLSSPQTPDLVLGRPDFTIPSGPFGNDTPCNTGGLSSRAFCFPSGLAVDRRGRLYVADSGNHRVLRFDQPQANGQSADLVLGQPNFTTAACNSGGVSASSLCGPFGLAVDFRADPFVADSGNHRVLRFDQPSNGTQPPTGTISVGVP